MDEGQEVSSNEQVAPVETEIQDVVQEQPQEDRNQRNWKELNRAKKELEHKARMQDELIERLMRSPQNQAAPVMEQDELDQVSDSDYLDKSKSKRLVQKQVEPLQKRIDELEAKMHNQAKLSQYNSLKSKFTDFDDVVNPETIALFEEQEPELAQTIIELKDPYKIGIQTYKYIKALNIVDGIPQSRRSKDVEKKIDQNKKTVQTPQAFDKRPMAQAFKMTETEKTKLYEEMMGYAAQAGFSY